MLAVLFVLITGINQVWGIGFNKGNVIFRAQGWDNPAYVYLCIGKSDYTSVYQMSRIGSTDLYHVWVNVDNNDNNWWNGCTYFAVIGSSSSVSSGSWDNSSLSSKGNKGYTAAYTSSYDINNSDGCYFFNKTNSTVNGGSFSISYTSFGSIQKYNAIQNAKKRDSGSSYSNVSGAFPAPIKLQGEHLTGNASSGRNTITRTSSSQGNDYSTYSAVVTGTITHSIDEENLSSDYYLEGWGGNNLEVTDRTYEYKITANTTIYAYFSHLYTLTFLPKGTYGTSTVTASVTDYTDVSSGDKIPTGHNITVTATPEIGYEIVGWYSDASCNTSLNNDTNTTYTISSLNANRGVYVKFQKKTYSITLDDNGSYQGEGSATVQYGDAALTVSSHARRTNWNLLGYWTASGNNGYQVADDSGNLIAGVSDWTDENGKWIKDANSTVSLYAHWSQSYSVTYNANGGTGTTVDASSPYAPGSNVTVLSNSFEYTGYTFTGWNTESNGSGTPYAVGATIPSISGNVTLFAQWSDIKTTVNLAASPANSGTFTVGGNAETSVEAGLATNPTITAVPTTGFWLNTSSTIWTRSDNKITIDDDDAVSTSISADGTGGTSTLTATFSPQYVLRGSVDADGDPAGGMAGWGANDNSSYSSFTYENGVYTIVAALTQQGTKYKFRIRDVVNNVYHGGTSGSAMMGDNEPWTLDGDGGGQDVHFKTTVIGNYTFVIDITGTHPSVKILFPVEPTYSATIVNSNISGSNVSPKGIVTLKPVTTTDIRATVPAGFRFGGWTVDSDHAGSVTFGDQSSESTTVTATASGATITATYSQAGFIYFDDSNSDWGKGGSANVYVYFFSDNRGWYDTENSGKGAGLVPVNQDRGQGQMTRIGYTNIYYFDYQSANITPGSYVGFTKGYCNGYYKVQNTSAAWRTDFSSSCYPMYVASSSYSTTNLTGYHSTGYWKNYNVTNSNVWLHGTWDTNKDGDKVEYDDDDAIEFTAVESNSNIFKAEVELSNRDYWFYLHRSCKNEYLKNTGTITTSVKNWEFTPGAASNCKITAPAPGKYIFTLVMNDDKIRLNVDFPLQQDDYRLLHYDGYLKTTEGANHPHPSQHVSHLTQADTTVRDTLSFFIDKDHKGSIKLQKCTDPAANSGRGAWADSLYNSSPITIDISGITKTGIYNFEIVQTTNASGVRTATINRLNNGGDGYEYDGKLYIRTNAADGGWDDYKVARDNQLIYSTIAKESGYDYYHCHWIGNGTNVKFCIANDYSPCITDSLTGDTLIGGSATYDDAHQTLPHEANVRFMYNSEQNTISRAYLNGAGLAQRFLVFQGDGKSYNSDGSAIVAVDSLNLDANELEFDDKGNWVYQSDIKAITDAKVNVVADYNSHTQNLIKNQTLITTQSGDVTQYPLRVVYDFKTNQLVSAWTPDGSEITTDMTVTADMMLIRTAQNAAKQIRFSGGQKISKIQTMVGAIEFRKDSIVNRVNNFSGDVVGPTGNRAYREMMLYISFPFDVAIQDIYGIGQLNKEWYIQYYDGAERARKGFFRGDGTTTFWKFMTINDTLRANVGYSLLLDTEYFNTDGDGTVWKNIKAGGSVYLYFPSTNELPGNKVIKSGTAYVTLDAHEHTSGRTFEVNSKPLNHNFTDSYWNMMGVPLFENKTDLSANFDYAADPSEMPGGGKGYFYEWDSLRNELNIRNASDYVFKSMHGYMVQYGGTVTFTGSSIQPAIAARRAPMNAENYTMELQLLQNNQRVSRTYVELREEACDTFALNEDVYMIYTSLPADMYTLAGNYDVSANVLSVQNHTIPVGVEVHKAGLFTFTMPSNFSGKATLIDTQTGTRTNLALDDYAVNLEKGVYDGRFFIEIELDKMPTAIDGVEGEGSLKDGKAHKFIENGMMYILKDGKLYDARGSQVK